MPPALIPTPRSLDWRSGSLPWTEALRVTREDEGLADPAVALLASQVQDDTQAAHTLTDRKSVV